MHLGSVSIESCSTLSAEVAVTGVEIECTDAVFAASTLELYSPFYPLGSVVCHHLRYCSLRLGRKDAPRWAVEGNESLRSRATTDVSEMFQQLSRCDGALVNNVAETDVKCGTMEATTRKPSVVAMVLALLMLLFGFLMFLFGYFALSEWRSERAALIASGMVWILAGPVVFGSALWLSVSLGRGPLALRIGGTALVASGTVLATAAAVGVLPCSGPS